MLLSRSVNIPVCLEVGRGRAKIIGDILSSHSISFQKSVLVTTEHLDLKYRDYLDLKFSEKVFINKSDEKNVVEVEKRLRKHDPDTLVVAFGGGKTIDVAKSAASKVGMNYLSVPTAISSDGIYSPVSVITGSDGKKKSLGANVPLGIIIDLDIVKTSPRELILAGVGDLISNISALDDWKLAKKNKIESIDDFAYTISFLSSGSILDLDLVDVDDYGFLKTLAYGLITSGLSMEIAGSSRPCSGAEHMFSHALDYLYPEKSRPHGIQVAFGTLLMEKWRGHDISPLVSFFRKVGLPATIQEFGISRGAVAEAFLYAPKIRDRFTILNKKKPTKSGVEELLAEF
jgi:glycerol-1-phosphate dehydrogenase [NAD(P)+]